MPRTQWRNFQGLASYLTVLRSCAGSGIFTSEMMMNARAKTPIAMKSRGATSDIAVLSVTVPISTPTSRGVRVPVSEFIVPPIWMN